MASDEAEALRAFLQLALPEGWSHMYDEHGQSYFEHAVTGETSWEVPSTTNGAGDQIAALQEEIKRLKHAEKKLAKDQKKQTVKEGALKTDLSKMTIETKSLKRELDIAIKEAKFKAMQSEERVARAFMENEENLQRLVEEQNDMIIGVVRSFRRRDMGELEKYIDLFRYIQHVEAKHIVIGAMKDGIAEYETHKQLEASLRTSIRDLEETVASERQERIRLTEHYEGLMKIRDDEIANLSSLIGVRDAHIAELQQYIDEAEERHRIEKERARQYDRNIIVGLESRLLLANQTHEESMETIAEMWPEYITPPSLLRKYVIPLREGEKYKRQQKALDALRIGSQVQAWDEESQKYHEATVSALSGGAVEIRWNTGSEEPPAWVPLEHCIAIIEEDLYKVKEIATQTTLALYDEEIRVSRPKRPISATSRLDAGSELQDRLAISSLKRNAKHNDYEVAEKDTKSLAEKLFRIIDTAKEKELGIAKIWDAIVNMEAAREFISENPLLHPLRRNEYLVMSWKQIDEDGELTMPFSSDEFKQLCTKALLLSRRTDAERAASAINESEIVDKEISIAIANEEDQNIKAQFDAMRLPSSVVTPFQTPKQNELQKELERLEIEKKNLRKNLADAQKEDVGAIKVHGASVLQMVSKAETARDEALASRVKARDELMTKRSEWANAFNLLDKMGQVTTQVDCLPHSKLFIEIQVKGVLHPEQEAFVNVDGSSEQSDADGDNEQPKVEKPNVDKYSAQGINWDLLFDKLSDHIRVLGEKTSLENSNLQTATDRHQQLVSEKTKLEDDHRLIQTKLAMLQTQAQEQANVNTETPPSEEEKAKMEEEKAKREIAITIKEQEMGKLVKSLEGQNKLIQQAENDMTAIKSRIGEFGLLEERLKAGKLELKTFHTEDQNMNSNLEAMDRLVDVCHKDIETAEQSAMFWKEEITSSEEQSILQQRCMESMDKVEAKLVEEDKNSLQALRSLVEHRELLFSRRFAASQERHNAGNDLEKSIAEEHYSFVEKEVREGLRWVKERWSVELESRETLLRRYVLRATKDSLRLDAALQTILERGEIRDLIAEEIRGSSGSGGSRDAIARAKAIRLLANRRETAWNKESVELVENLETTWIAEQEKQRLQLKIDFATREAKHAKEHYGERKAKLENEMSLMQSRFEKLQLKYKAQEERYVKELDALSEASRDSLTLLQKQLEAEKAKFADLVSTSREHLQITQEDYLAMRMQLEGEVRRLSEVLNGNRHWIGMLQQDIKNLKQRIIGILMDRDRERNKYSKTLDNTRQQLEAMTQHASRLDNWVNSLKNEVKMLNDTVQACHEESERVAEESRKQVRWAKWETWKRDETARSLGTNVDFMFLYFAEALARLAGSSQEANERIAVNAGIPVLLAMLESSRIDIRRHAITALTAATYNSHVDLRTLSRLTRNNWKKWVQSVTVISTLRWHREQKQLALRGDNTKGEAEPVSCEGGMTVRMHKNRVQIVPQSVAQESCGVNLSNQARVGKGLAGYLSGVETLLKLLNSDDLVIVEKSIGALAMLALEHENREIIGQVPGALDLLFSLSCLYVPYEDDNENNQPEQTEEKDQDNDRVEDDNPTKAVIPGKTKTKKNSIPPVSDTEATEKEDIQRGALNTIANLMYDSLENQTKLYKMGGVKSLIRICKYSKDVDVLDSATAALANATSLHDESSEQIGEEGGLEVLVQLCDSELGNEKLDNVGERIQTNSIQTLVNATKSATSANSAHIMSLGAAPLIKLCMSTSLEVRRHAAMIVGNVSQDDTIRASVGKCGGVEALFAMCDMDDIISKTNALWALSNLAWNSANQNAIGKQFAQLIDLCLDPEVEVRINATAVLANALFYHEGNRRRFGLYTKCCTTMIRLLKDEEQPNKVLENAARAIGTAAYNDAIAMQAGILNCIPDLIRLTKSPIRGNQRCAAFALGNLAVHDIHKTVIIQNNGVEAMTTLCGSDCKDTVKHASRVLEVLADMSRAEEIEARREKFGLNGLISLCRGDPEYDRKGNLIPRQANLQALACDELAQEASLYESKRRDFLQLDGPGILVRIVGDSLTTRGTLEDPIQRKLQQRALWAMRAVTTEGGEEFQDAFGKAEAISVCTEAIRQHWERILELKEDEATLPQDIPGVDQGISVNLVNSKDVCEAALGTLFELTRGHETNCRRTLQDGLDILITIAQKYSPPAGGGTVDIDDLYIRAPMGGLSMRILEVMGPHSWIRCANCSSKEKGGTICSGCGHSLPTTFIY